MDTRSTRVAEEVVSRLMQVLLVDHDGVNRYTVSKSLQRVGYIIVEASFGDEALDLFNNQHFDLVLSEIDLPGIDGIELLQRIKAESPDAMVVLMTENASVESAVQALRSGAHDYLIKPCSSQEIRASVDRGIERARNLVRRRRMLDAIERNVGELVREEALAAVSSDDASLEPLAPAARDRAAATDSVMALAGLSVAPGRYQIGIGDQSINLTPTEFDLLLYLAAHRSRVVPCQELVREVRGYTTDESEAREVIRPHVSNLRRKLKMLGDYKKLVVNVRGIGYRLGDLSDPE
ncbi:MAG: response regulator transcription factor [Chloroflexi bacterium]|nr:response regulator transcription factor [Chloroflexota bacterium]